MTFTEPPDPKLSLVHVLDVNGTTVEAGPVEAVPGHDDQLRIPLPADLPDGVYTVSWRVVSEADGHATAGAFSFGVNVAPGTVVTPEHPGSDDAVALRRRASRASSCLYVGLALLFAAAVVGIAGVRRRSCPRGGAVLLVAAGGRRGRRRRHAPVGAGDARRARWATCCRRRPARTTSGCWAA